MGQISGAEHTKHVDQVLGVLSHPDEDDLGSIVALLAHVCEADAAGLTLRRLDQYHVPFVRGLDPLVCASAETFCQHTMDIDDVFCVEDAHEDPRFAEIAWVDGRLARARFYASAPVYAPSGDMVGRLCVLDAEPRTLSPVMRHSLETLARLATREIELRLLRAWHAAPSTTAGDHPATTAAFELATELSHDLRVPLTSVIASVEMLSDELGQHTQGPVAALVRQTSRAADRMVRMLDQYMEHATKHHAPPTRQADLTRVVQQLLLDSSMLLESLGAVVHAEPLPVVRADPDEMYSVMQNLVTNAVKFARPDLPSQVRIFARRRPDAWRITVRDNGVGIPREQRGEVFGLFTRASQDVRGFGIGLATVSRVVRSYGGSVGADEAPDGGTDMWFDLPDRRTR